MNLIRLSAVLADVPVAVSDVVLKDIRNAVAEGRVMGAQLGEKFTVPRPFRKRGSDEPVYKLAYDMALRNDAELLDVMADSVERATSPRSRATRKTLQPSYDDLQDEAAFMAAFERTREKIIANASKGANMANKRKAAATPAPVVDDVPLFETKPRGRKTK